MPPRPAGNAVRTARVTSGELLELFAWLDRDPVVNVYLVALLLRDRLGAAPGECWLARRAGALAGLVHLCVATGAVLPAGDGPDVHDALAELVASRLAILPSRFLVVGDRAAVGSVVDRLRPAGLEPGRHHPQTYMAVERGGLSPFEPLPELRPARPEDYDIVHRSGADLRAEELGDDPREGDPHAYARRVEEECRGGYTWLWLEGGALRFRASVSALTADAAQIAGVYTPPGQRGRGYAARGLAELCSRQLARVRAACLFVGDGNTPARALYDRLGFRPRAAWASAFFDRAPHPTP